ncbi:MAG: gamma-glutamyltransferase family protein [Dehalococcoidia bacterium]
MEERADLANLGAMPVPWTNSDPETNTPRRGAVYASKFGVAADQQLASLAAIDILKRGGNAADAAIAAAAVNIVTKPQRTHIGGDVFALVWRRGANTIEALNAGGRAPNKATLDLFPNGIDVQGPRACTVPGFPDALLEMHVSHGSFNFDKLLEPAIRYAEEGFPVSMRLSGAMQMLPGIAGQHGDALRSVFLKDGKPYAPGEIIRQPDLAATLKRLVLDGREGFYEGETAKLIADGMSAAGGLIDTEDLSRQTAHWHDALQTTYRGLDVYEQALPSQGIILLEALNIVENFPIADWGFLSADTVHVLLEATKIAFADSHAHMADPEVVDGLPVEMLLSKDYAKKRAAEIDMKRAGEPAPAILQTATTEFVVADQELAIAFIQSVFSPWGSGFMVPGTGVLMNNRLRGFNTTPGHPNALEPGKRTMHTLNTFMAMKGEEMVCGGGSPGGDFQVQTNLQTLTNVVDFSMELQTAVDTPRWVTLGRGELVMESRYPAAVIEELRSRGHDVHVTAAWDPTLQKTQVMATLPGGGWAFASDLRGEGLALGQ